MFKLRKSTTFWYSIIIIGAFTGVCVFFLNNFLFVKKDIVSKEQKINIVLNSKKYFLTNNIDFVTIKTMKEQGYIDSNFDKKCDLKTSYVSIIKSKYYLFLNCNDRLETLVLAY